MSAICQRIESAFVRFLIQEAGSQDLAASSFALATHATEIDVTPTGLRVETDDAGEFELNFYAGESEEKVTLPAVVVVCANAARMEDVPNVQTADVEISLEVQVDSTNDRDSVAWLDEASRWMHGVLSGQSMLADALQIAEPQLVVSYVSTPDCGRSVEGRRRIHRWTIQVAASH